ncbi:putative glycosyltransferase [Bacillus sp. TS-2]|nr:putative glycosyltransferase [Bacillus sp. TS-2]
MERYLARCLKSLVSQSLQEIEIIAINDGSTDNSLKILEGFSKTEERLIVVNQDNRGVSASRNKGIELARGQFIGFVDPDDWIEKEMYQRMYEEAIRGDLEVVMCSYIREFGEHSRIKNYHLPEVTLYENEEVSKIVKRLIGPVNEELSSPEFLDAWGTIWSKLYKAKIIKEQKIRFIDLNLIGTNEDSLFNLHVFFYVKKFMFIHKPYYHYWKENEASLTTKYKTDLQKKWNYLYEIIALFIEEKQLSEEYTQALNNRVCLNTLGLGLNEISSTNEASFREKILCIKRQLNEPFLKEAFRHFELKHCSIVWKVFYYCAQKRKATSLFLLLLCIEAMRKMKR